MVNTDTSNILLFLGTGETNISNWILWTCTAIWVCFCLQCCPLCIQYTTLCFEFFLHLKIAAQPEQQTIYNQNRDVRMCGHDCTEGSVIQYNTTGHDFQCFKRFDGCYFFSPCFVLYMWVSYFNCFAYIFYIFLYKMLLFWTGVLKFS